MAIEILREGIGQVLREKAIDASANGQRLLQEGRDEEGEASLRRAVEYLDAIHRAGDLVAGVDAVFTGLGEEPLPAQFLSNLVSGQTQPKTGEPIVSAPTPPPTEQIEPFSPNTQGLNLTGKVAKAVELLARGSKTRDQIIVGVWGEINNVTSNRFHALMPLVKKKLAPGRLTVLTEGTDNISRSRGVVGTYRLTSMDTEPTDIVPETTDEQADKIGPLTLRDVELLDGIVIPLTESQAALAKILINPTTSDKIWKILSGSDIYNGLAASQVNSRIRRLKKALEGSGIRIVSENTGLDSRRKGIRATYGLARIKNEGQQTRNGSSPSVAPDTGEGTVDPAYADQQADQRENSGSVSGEYDWGRSKDHLFTEKSTRRAEEGTPLLSIEKQMLLMIAQELTESEITRRLRMSIPRARTLRQEIYAKLGCSNSYAEAIDRALTLGELKITSLVNPDKIRVPSKSDQQLLAEITEVECIPLDSMTIAQSKGLDPEEFVQRVEDMYSRLGIGSKVQAVIRAHAIKVRMARST